ncbi:MAG: glycosyltransferase family 4 protein [Acidobacteria bacterium]|nr:glycosyltransferase family 4 protein [Acidobacteriota bacterium]
MTPRIAVNLLWCQPGRVGGSEQYLARQLAGLASTGPLTFDVAVYAPRGYATAHPELATFAVNESRSVGANRAARIVRESTWLERRTRGVAVTHHGGGTVPFRTNGRTLLTVHDVQYLTYPQYFSRARLAYLSYMMPRSLRRADAVAVPSQYVRGTLIDRFGLDASAVHVVVHGIESVDRASLDIVGVQQRHGLMGTRYFIYPAITHPHKNHRFLVDLVAGPWRDTNVHLLFIGGEGRAHAEIVSHIASSGVADRVQFTGHVGSADRDALVAGADALVFPSEYEGFGAPVVEAMALGVPVVASDRASLPGVVGDGGLVLPLDAAMWADVPQCIGNDRDVLVAAGRARAESFSLLASGRDLRGVYEGLLR